MAPRFGVNILQVFRAHVRLIESNCARFFLVKQLNECSPPAAGGKVGCGPGDLAGKEDMTAIRG